MFAVCWWNCGGTWSMWVLTEDAELDGGAPTWPWTSGEEASGDLRKATLTLARQLDNLLRLAGAESVPASESTLFELDERILVVSVVGRTRVGKSTLLNALVGEGTLVAPVDVVTCTAAISSIEHAHVASTMVHCSDLGRQPAQVQALIRHLWRGGPTPLPPVPAQALERDQLEKWVTHSPVENPGLPVALARICVPARHLPGATVFLDAPGICSNAAEDRPLANLAAGEADVIVFVYSDVSNLGDEEMSFLIDQLATVSSSALDAGASACDQHDRAWRREVFVVQNDWGRSDLDRDTWEVSRRKVLRETKRAIQAAWTRRQADDPDCPRGPALGADIFRVDAKAAWHGVQHELPEQCEQSRVPELLRAIAAFCDHGRGVGRLRRATSKLTTAARRLEAQTRQQLERVRADELATQGRMRALVAARARMVSRDGDLTVREMARLVQDAATLDLRETREELESQVLMAIEALEMDADEDLAATCDGAKGRLDRAARKAARHSSGRGGHVEGVCQTLLAELAILEEATAGRQETAGRKALPRIPPPSFPRLQVEVNFEASDGVVASVIDSFHWTWPFFGSRARENFRDALEEARRMIMASAQRHGRQAREKQVAEVVAYLTSRRGQVLRHVEKCSARLESGGAEPGGASGTPASRERELEALLKQVFDVSRRLYDHAQVLDARLSEKFGHAKGVEGPCP